MPKSTVDQSNRHGVPPKPSVPAPCLRAIYDQMAPPPRPFFAIFDLAVRPFLFERLVRQPFGNLRAMQTSWKGEL